MGKEEEGEGNQRHGRVVVGGSRESERIVAMGAQLGSHGSHTLACAHRGKSAGEGESEGGRRGDTRALGYGVAGRETARGTEVGRASAMVGARSMHSCHDALSSNTW